MNTQRRNVVLLAALNLAITASMIGCGQSVPQESAQGGILSGTETERNRYANKRNPLLAGNAQQEVTASSSSTPSALSTSTPRALTTAPTAAPAPAPAPGAAAGESTTTPPPPPAPGAAGTTPAPRASETGGTNPRGGVTNGTVPGGPERTTGGGTGGGQP